MCGFLSEFGKKRLFFDGAMGTMLQQKGLAGEKSLSFGI